MHRQLTDTTRRRAERTIRTIVNDGPNTSAPIETNLLMRTVTWDFVPVSDPQRLWNWGWMEQPSVREVARQSLEKDGAIDDYALHELLVEKEDMEWRKHDDDDRQFWLESHELLDEITRFLSLFESIRPSDDWNVMFSRAYIEFFVHEWEQSIGVKKAPSFFLKLGAYIAARLYATSQYGSLKRTLAKSGSSVDEDRITEYWHSCVHEYNRWLKSGIVDRTMPDYVKAAYSGDIELYWKSVNKAHSMPRIGKGHGL